MGLYLSQFKFIFGANQSNHAMYSAMIVRDVFESTNKRNYLKEDIILCIEKHN